MPYPARRNKRSKSYLVTSDEFYERLQRLSTSERTGKHCLGAATYLVGLQQEERPLQNYNPLSIGLQETDKKKASMIGFVLSDWSRPQKPPRLLVHLAAIDPKNKKKIHNQPKTNAVYESLDLEELLKTKHHYEAHVKQSHIPYLFSIKPAYFRPTDHYAISQ